MKLLLTYLLSTYVLLLSAQQRTGKDYAYFFAVDNYEARADWSSLRNPVRDARALAGELKDMYGFETHVFENPDQATIDREIRKLRGKSFGPDDQLLLFFSGHGDFDDYRQRGYFLPAGGSDKFSLLDMRDVITPIGCEHILLLVDACYSGTIDEAIAYKGRGERPGITRATARQEMIDRKLRNRSRLLLTSGGKQRTPDGVDGSPFTIGVLTALRRGYGTGDGIVTYEDVLAALERVSPTPHNGEMPGHEQGSFVFVSKGGAAVSRSEPPVRPRLPEPRTETPVLVHPDKLRATPGTEGLDARTAEVISEVLSATGGIEAWRRVTTVQLTQTATYNNGNVFTQQAYLSKDGKRAFRQTDAYGNFLAMVYDGSSARVINPYSGSTFVQSLTGTDRQDLVNSPMPDLHVDPIRRGYRVTRLDDQSQGGSHYYVLNYRHDNGYNADIWYDKKTHLPTWEFYQSTSGGINLHLASNHRFFSGVLMPTKVITTFSDGSIATSVVTELYVNAPIDPSVFRLR